MSAKPSADSEAPTVSRNNEYISPVRSSKNREKQMKLMLIPSNISSKDINNINTFFLRTKTPKTPSINKKKEDCNIF